MAATWIVSANASRARFFFHNQFAEPLQEISDLVNPAAHLRAAETESDRLGPTSAAKSMHNSGGAAPNKAYEPRQTPAEHQMELFARKIAEELLQAYQEGRFRQLYLVASPQLLGVLRKLLDTRLEHAVKLEINKDYTQLTPVELLEQIEDFRQRH